MNIRKVPLTGARAAGSVYLYEPQFWEACTLIVAYNEQNLKNIVTVSRNYLYANELSV